jgi:hypothetical protein
VSCVRYSGTIRPDNSSNTTTMKSNEVDRMIIISYHSSGPTVASFGLPESSFIIYTAGTVTNSKVLVLL